jgi:hypothetical protein
MSHQLIIRNLSIVLLSAATLTACSSAKKAARNRSPMQVKVEAPFSDSFEYPELKELSKRTKNVGIAFSGGGSRAAAATAGQLRALNYLGLLDNVRYISCVSGGSWASISYTYLPEHISDEKFLGEYTAPERIRFKMLKKVESPSLTYILSNAKIKERLFNYWGQLKGDETYSSILNEIYLDPLGLGNRKKFFSYNDESIDSILQHNKHLSRNDFYKVNSKSNRPFLIVNATFIGGVKPAKALPSMHLEMTPLYSGITSYNEEYKMPVGGGYIQSFGMDTKVDSTGTATGYATVKVKQIFSLADMMATSGNAPGTVINRINLTGLGAPEIYLWSPHQHWDNKYKLENTSDEYAIGDGGNSENLGLVPLLKRKVEKIIVFANSKKPITRDSNTGDIEINDAVCKVFGVYPSYSSFGNHDMAVHVLENNRGELDTLKNVLYRKMGTNEALIVTRKYKVRENLKFGVYTNGYDSVEITWVYNDNPKRFLEILDGNKDEKLKKWLKHDRQNQKQWPFKTTPFPQYTTFGVYKGINYKPMHANLLAHFTSWVVVENRKAFEDIFK